MITTDSDKQYDKIIKSNGIEICRIYHEDQNMQPPQLLGVDITADIIERDDLFEFSMIGYDCAHHYEDCLEKGFRWEEYNAPAEIYETSHVNRSCKLFSDLDKYDAI